MVDSELVYKPAAEIVSRALLEASAYIISETMNPDDFFTWKSGVRAPVYTDCRLIQGHPGSFRTILGALARSVEHNFPRHDAVVGMAEAGIVWSSPVSVDLGVPHAFVRKSRKAHGLGRMVEGSLTSSSRIVLVDDLMAGGGTVRDAIQLIEQETRAHIVGVQTIVNWDFREMRDIFDRMDIPYRALVSYPQILDAAVDAGKLTRRAGRELASFYADPHNHSWKLDELVARDRHDGWTGLDV